MSLDLTTKDQQDGWNALERLLRIARQDTGQARRVANFLLAWHNAEENGGWDPVDLWNVDAAIADDMLTVLRLVRESHRYPNDLGFTDEIAAVWRLWRGGQTSTEPDRSAGRKETT
jgi:ParB family transcriptional regulator, chromosome partitioning protein